MAAMHIRTWCFITTSTFNRRLNRSLSARVDLVMANAVKNPNVVKSIFDSADDVYAAEQ